MATSEIQPPQLTKELQKDLAQKYRIHGEKIEKIWHSFHCDQRAEVFEASAAEGVVLKDSNDASLGNVYKVIPEFNLEDIIEPRHLLELLKHRATRTLCEQYAEGANGGPGDAHFILKSMRDHGLCHTEPFTSCFTFFTNEETYGQSFKVMSSANDECMADLSTFQAAGFCVPQSTGELILLRQLYTLQSLNVIIGEILRSESPDTRVEGWPTIAGVAARAAFAKLSFVSKPDQLQTLLNSTLDQKYYHDENLGLCRAEPKIFMHLVSNWFYSRPELVQDKNGLIPHLFTDKYISIAIYELVNNALVGAASWGYLACLVSLYIEVCNDRIGRTIILQEMSNVAHWEYGRVRQLFKRQVQIGSGSSYFKRVSGTSENGVPRVNMTIKPECLTKENPQVHYMLRLCQAETDASKAIFWIKKLDDLHRSHPTEQEKMTDGELESFGDLAVIATFVRSLSMVLQLPPIHLKKGQIFTTKLKDLTRELEVWKSGVDLTKFAAPIDSLIEPGMAEGALDELDQFIVHKTGTKIEFLYQDLIETCESELQSYYQQRKEEIEQNVPRALLTDTASPEVQTQQRREKNKTRPSHSSIYDIAPTPDSSAQPEAAELQPIFKVKQDTVAVFSTLFTKAESRGAITWMAFEAAMVDLNFSVTPRMGSVFTFSPPQDMRVQRSITLHRPHKSHIEGYKLLTFANRLKKVYGWGLHSFEVA